MKNAKDGNIEELKIIYQNASALNITNQIINVQDEEGKSALFWSISNDNIATAEYIIEIGADVNAATNYLNVGSEGNTPLMEASRADYMSIVKKLLQNDAKVNATQKDGTHAAYLAAEIGNLEIIKLLIAKDPSVVDLKGYQGRTPLYAASKDGYLNIVKYLNSFPQTNIDSQANYGATALIWAVYTNHPKTVRVLLEEGADPSIEDNFGKNSFEWANYKNLTVIKQILEEWI